MNGHPEWFQPTKGRDAGLKCHNSLTGDVDPFIPKNGNKVMWYSCGPTVYDVSHMGHARAYLTFDILRRLMIKYFKYDVTYQINITDIDDKIILRSRQNKLYDDYCEKNSKKNVNDVKKDVDAAVEFAKKKLDAKAPQPPQEKSEKAEAQYKKLTQEHALKL